MNRHWAGSLLFALVGCLIVPAGAAAQTPAEFFRGKTITLGVGSPAAATMPIAARSAATMAAPFPAIHRW